MEALPLLLAFQLALEAALLPLSPLLPAGISQALLLTGSFCCSLVLLLLGHQWGDGGLELLKEQLAFSLAISFPSMGLCLSPASSCLSPINIIKGENESDIK